jgi:hypothetical protein
MFKQLKTRFLHAKKHENDIRWNTSTCQTVVERLRWLFTPQGALCLAEAFFQNGAHDMSEVQMFYCVELRHEALRLVKVDVNYNNYTWFTDRGCFRLKLRVYLGHKNDPWSSFLFLNVEQLPFEPHVWRRLQHQIMSPSVTVLCNTLRLTSRRFFNQYAFVVQRLVHVKRLHDMLNMYSLMFPVAAPDRLHRTYIYSEWKRCVSEHHAPYPLLLRHLLLSEKGLAVFSAMVKLKVFLASAFHSFFNGTYGLDIHVTVGKYSYVERYERSSTDTPPRNDICFGGWSPMCVYVRMQNHELRVNLLMLPYALFHLKFQNDLCCYLYCMASRVRRFVRRWIRGHCRSQ